MRSSSTRKVAWSRRPRVTCSWFRTDLFRHRRYTRVRFPESPEVPSSRLRRGRRSGRGRCSSRSIGCAGPTRCSSPAAGSASRALLRSTDDEWKPRARRPVRFRMATRRCWTLRRNGERGSSTERSTPLRSPCPSVGRFHLAANLPTGEIARSRVRRRDTIIRVDIHISGSRSEVFHQGAHRFARKGSDELRRVEAALSQNAIEATATRRRGRRTADGIQPDDDRARRVGVSEMDVRHDHVVDVRGNDLVMNRFPVRAQLEDGHPASIRVPRRWPLVDPGEDGIPMRSAFIVRPRDRDGERRGNEGHREQRHSHDSLRQTKSPPGDGTADEAHSLFPKPRAVLVFDNDYCARRAVSRRLAGTPEAHDFSKNSRWALTKSGLFVHRAVSPSPRRVFSSWMRNAKIESRSTMMKRARWRSTCRSGTYFETRTMSTSFVSLMSAASRAFAPRRIAARRASLIPARYDRWRPFVVVKARTSPFAAETNCRRAR